MCCQVRKPVLDQWSQTTAASESSRAGGCQRVVLGPLVVRETQKVGNRWSRGIKPTPRYSVKCGSCSIFHTSHTYSKNAVNYQSNIEFLLKLWSFSAHMTGMLFLSHYLNYFHEAVILILQVSEKGQPETPSAYPLLRHLLRWLSHHLDCFLPGPNQSVTLPGISSLLVAVSSMMTETLLVFISCLADNSTLQTLAKWMNQQSNSRKEGPIWSVFHRPEHRNTKRLSNLSKITVEKLRFKWTRARLSNHFKNWLSGLNKLLPTPPSP